MTKAETTKTRKPRKTYSEAERKQLMAEAKTSGRKGVRLPRINVAFTPDNYEYVNTMSRVRGETLTAFINHVIELNLEENKELYEQAIIFRNSL